MKLTFKETTDILKYSHSLGISTDTFFENDPAMSRERFEKIRKNRKRKVGSGKHGKNFFKTRKEDKK